MLRKYNIFEHRRDTLVGMGLSKISQAGFPRQDVLGKALNPALAKHTQHRRKIFSIGEKHSELAYDILHSQQLKFSICDQYSASPAIVPPPASCQANLVYNESDADIA